MDRQFVDPFEIDRTRGGVPSYAGLELDIRRMRKKKRIEMLKIEYDVYVSSMHHVRIYFATYRRVRLLLCYFYF